jgi:hypothetical protein
MDCRALDERWFADVAIEVDSQQSALPAAECPGHAIAEVLQKVAGLLCASARDSPPIYTPLRPSWTLDAINGQANLGGIASCEHERGK